MPTPPISQPPPIPEPDPAAIAAESEKLKEQGNDSFKAGPAAMPSTYIPKPSVRAQSDPCASQGRIGETWSTNNGPTTRLGTHRARLPHEPCSGVYRHQALPLRARGLPARGDATSGCVRGRRSTAKDAPPARPLPARPGPDDRGALDAAARALGGARKRTGDADADARARARGAVRNLCPVGAASGAWRASRSSGACASWRPRGARSPSSGGSGGSRSSLRAGTGMVRKRRKVRFSLSFRFWLWWWLFFDAFRGFCFFSDALRLQSNSPDVLALRGLVLFLCGRLPQALQHAQSALRYDPGHEPAQRLRKRVKEVERLKEEGNQAFKLGNLHEALRLYTEALEVCACALSFIFVYQTSFVLAGRRKRGRRKGRAVACVAIIKSRYYSRQSTSRDLIPHAF